MESDDTTTAVYSRIRSIDPENASKIMGFILLQDNGEKEMVRLAYGPDSLIQSAINEAKAQLFMLSNTSSASSTAQSSPSPFTSLSKPISISRPSPLNLSMPSLWANTHHHSVSPVGGHSLSYAAVVNGASTRANGSLSSSTGQSQMGFSGGNREGLPEDFHMQEQNVTFLNDPVGLQSKNGEFFDQSTDLAVSPGRMSDSVMYPYWENSNVVENNVHFHRRSCSLNDACFGTDDSTSGFGYKPCLYYAQGFCKNGTTCKFVHGGGAGGGGGFLDCCDTSAAVVGSPCKFDAFEQCQQELVRSKFAAQEQRLAQFMAGMNNPYNKSNFLQNDGHRSPTAALRMGEEFHSMNRGRMARNDFSGMGMNGDQISGARQIYLTFPADSTFKEEDVSNYFSLYGPVEDVRIPYQQKRMFGFVTFLYPETVKRILAKGNPHFVCDSRVLVKPYKEKGKLPDKKQQPFDRGEFSSCSSPTGLDWKEAYHLPLGPRMFYNSHEMLLRKKVEEQADLQQAIELQGRRLMNLQLIDFKNHPQYQHNVSIGSPIPSPSHTRDALYRDTSLPLNEITQVVSQENKGFSDAVDDQQLMKGLDAARGDNNGSNDAKEDSANPEECDLPESLEHILPDSLFASPTKSAGEKRLLFLSASVEVDGAATSSSSATNNDSLIPVTSSPSMTPLKSCFFEMSRFSSGQGAIGM